MFIANKIKTRESCYLCKSFLSIVKLVPLEGRDVSGKYVIVFLSNKVHVRAISDKLIVVHTHFVCSRKERHKR